LIHLPQSVSSWTSTLHQIYSWSLHGGVIMFICLITASVVLRARQDSFEFLQKLFEAIFTTAFYYELFYIKTHIRQVLALIRIIEDKFLTSHEDIVKAYDRQERVTICLVLIAVVMTLVLVVSETFIQFSPEELDKIRKLYDKKHPERILPINCWLPLVDTSDLGPYLVIYVVQVIALMLYFTSLSYSVIQVTAFLTPLEGQFRILARYVGMLGRSPRDPLGTYVWTPIGVLCKDEGTYRLDRRFLGKSEEEVERRFNEICANQCVKFSHILYEYMEEYRRFITPLKDPVVIPVTTIFALGLYQTSSISDLSPHAIGKVFIELFLLLISSYDFIRQSERLQTCQDLLYASVARCARDRLSPRARRTLCMILMRSRSFAHLRFLNGVYLIDNELLIRLFKVSYSFINFMKVAKALGGASDH
ncbi:hypothetical protein M8J76_015457, partial [Diaphorina citri]